MRLPIYIAALRAELTAARAVVAVARATHACCDLCGTMFTELSEALNAYDALVSGEGKGT